MLLVIKSTTVKVKLQIKKLHKYKNNFIAITSLDIICYFHPLHEKIRTNL